MIIGAQHVAHQFNRGILDGRAFGQSGAEYWFSRQIAVRTRREWRRRVVAHNRRTMSIRWVCAATSHRPNHTRSEAISIVDLRSRCRHLMVAVMTRIRIHIGCIETVEVVR